MLDILQFYKSYLGNHCRCNFDSEHLFLDSQHHRLTGEDWYMCACVFGILRRMTDCSRSSSPTETSHRSLIGVQKHFITWMNWMYSTLTKSKRIAYPVFQDTEQFSLAYMKVNFCKQIVPGQVFPLQIWLCVRFPVQSTPPCDGRGLVQVRLRDCDPLPHDWLQSLQAPQEDQEPFTNLK